MTCKLSEIFIPLSVKNSYLARELFALRLKPGFIKTIAANFELFYTDKPDSESNLCFAEDKQIRPEYRTTFSQADVLKTIFSQLAGETINLEQDEVVFSTKFFSS